MVHLPSLNAIRDGLACVVRRFPFVVLCAATGTALSIMSVQGDEWVFGNAIMACGLGLPVFFGLRILRENGRRAGQWLEALAVLLLAAYALSIPANPSDAPWMIILRYWILFLGAHFAVAFVPGFTGASESEYWEYNRRLCVRFFLAAVYSVVLFGGLSAALGSVSKLFALDVDSKRYAQLWVVMAGLFQPLFFLGGVGNEREWRAPQQPFKALQAFARFALAPLVVVYLAILYLYLFKLGVGRHWPHGWLAMPVSVLAVTGYLAALFIQPARGQAEERWANWYWRHFFRAIAPLSLLLIAALWKRTSEYGVTEWRYLGLVLGMWLLATSTYYAFRASASTRLIPFSLALVCLAVSWGPWDAFSVSRASQFQRLEDILGPKGLKNGRLAANSEPASGKVHDEICSILAHMIGAYGVASLEAIMPEDLASRIGGGARNRTWVQTNAVVAYLSGSDDLSNPKGASPGFINVDCELGNGVPVSGYRNIFSLEYTGNRRSAHIAGDLKVSYAPGELTFELQGRRLDAGGVRAMITSVAAQAQSGTKKFSPAQMSAVISEGPRHWQVVARRIQFWRDSAATNKTAVPKLYSIWLYLLEQ